VDPTVFEFKPMVFPPSDDRHPAPHAAGHGAVQVTEDHELIANARSLVTLAHDHLNRAEMLSDSRLLRHSFDTLDASTLGGMSSHHEGAGGRDEEQQLAAHVAVADARCAFKAALELDPSCVEALVGLAELKCTSRTEARALLGHLRDAVEVDAGCAAAWHAIGTLLGGMGRWHDAAAHFQEACSLDMHNAKYKAAFDDARTKVNSAMGPAEAREVFSEGTHTDASMARHVSTLVEAGNRLLDEPGMALDATRAFAAALLLDPACVPAHAGLSEGQLKRGDLSRALDAAYAALACDGLARGGPSDSSRLAMQVLAECYERRGDVPEAVAWRQRAAVLFKDDDESSVASSSTQSSAGRSVASASSHMSKASTKSHLSKASTKTAATNISALTHGTHGTADFKSAVSLASFAKPPALSKPDNAALTAALDADGLDDSVSHASSQSGASSKKSSRSLQMPDPDNH